MKPIGRCGRYELLEKVSGDGMGEVFRARGLGADGVAHDYALKRLVQEVAQNRMFVRMLIDEARLATRLTHPNVCRVFGMEQDDQGMHHLVMEWIDGVSLRELIGHGSERRALPVDVAARIASQIAAALDHAHVLRDDRGRALGVVHRAVSPTNVMIAKDGTAKLLDFGLAKARTQLQKTRPGMVKGLYGYLAPEQLTGQVDVRTDVFQLGLVLFEMLTGRRVFEQPDAAATIAAIGAYEVPPSARSFRSEVPEALDAVLERALARDPAARFPNAADMRAAIDAAVPALPGRGRTVVAAEVAARLGPEEDETVPRMPLARDDPGASPAATGGEPAEPSVDVEVDAAGTERGRGIWGWVMIFLAILLAAAAFVGTAVYLRESGQASEPEPEVVDLPE